MEFRKENDSIGEREIEKDAYYGVQSFRASENFKITGLHAHKAMIRSVAELKKASALVNAEVGMLDQKIADAIVQACDEIIAGDEALINAFIVDPVQGGAGTSFNMNANEVIANRAIEILGGKKGDYSIVHPNDHVNFGQSTNDVFPSCGKLAIIRRIQVLRKKLALLRDELMKKAVEFDGIIKMGRTEMQDAVPMRLGQSFEAYAASIDRCIVRLSNAITEMSVLNMGATAIGTCLNADLNYVEKIVPKISEITGLPLRQSANLIDGTQSAESFVSVSGMVKACAVQISKIAHDLRLMSSGPRTGFGEINLPARQNGSSIMPGKVNPVIPEVVSEVAFAVCGYDTTVTMAAEAGQLELNAFEPIIFQSILSSVDMLGNAAKTFAQECISGITANAEHCEELVENSVGIITALCPFIGYAQSAKIAKKAIRTGRSVRELIMEEGILTEEELNKVLDPYKMTSVLNLKTLKEEK